MKATFKSEKIAKDWVDNAGGEVFEPYSKGTYTCDCGETDAIHFWLGDTPCVATICQFCGMIEDENDFPLIKKEDFLW